MSLDVLRTAVLNANLATREHGLVKSTFGNVSGINRVENVIAIKPSGVEYDDMRAENMVISDVHGVPSRLNDGVLNPSSDLLTHVELYHAFKDIGAVVHTHSPFATIFAQLKMEIRPFGTTHADYFHGSIPVTRDLTLAEIGGDYVRATGLVIVERFTNLSPEEVPAVLVAGHGPFVWGKTPAEAVVNAVMLEEAARLAWHVQAVSPEAPAISQELLDRHYYRKHGSNATYGQTAQKVSTT